MDHNFLGRDQTHTSCIASWILNHWTAKEVPVYSFLKIHVDGEGLGRQEGGEGEPLGQASMPSGTNRPSDGQCWASAAATVLPATRGPGADNQEVPAAVP